MRRTAAVLGFIAVCRASTPTNRAPAQRAPQPSPLPAAGESPEEYLRRYAGEWVPEVHNVSDAHEWKTASQDAFMKKYATEYRSYVFNWQRLSTVLAAAPQNPSKCDTLTCLKQWFDAQLDKIKEYVPETWRPLAENSLKKEYMYFKKKMEAKLQKPNSSHAGAGANRSQAEASVNSSHPEAGANSSHAEEGTNSSHTGAGPVELAASIQPLGMSPAWYINRYAGDWVPTVQNASDGQEWWKNFMDDRVAQFAHYEQDSARLAKEFGDAPANAGDCHTLGDLKKWRDARLASIHAFEPKAFQGFATKAVNDEYESNSARIAKEEAAKTAEGDEARIAKEEAAKSAKSANASEVPASLMALPELAQAESYMGDYADQWVPRAQSNESWSPESYMADYADHWIPHDQSSKSLSPESYVNQYAAGYAGDYVPALSDRDEWQQRFTGSYVEADRHYAADAERIQRKFANAPQKASECHTLEALKQWREAQRARMGAFVPKMWQRIASDSIDREFEANKVRITQERVGNATGSERAANATRSERADNVSGSEPVQFVSFADSMNQFAEQWMPSSARGVDVSPEWYINRYAGNSVPKIHNASDGCAWRRNFLSRYAEAYEHFVNDSQRLSQEYADAPRHARDARDMKELEAWKGAQLARIHAFVAHTFQGLAEDSVERAFRKGRARLQEAAASAQNGTQAARPAAAAGNNTSLATEGGAGSSTAAAVLVLVASLGALTVAFASRAARHRADGEEVEDVYVQV